MAKKLVEYSSLVLLEPCSFLPLITMLEVCLNEYQNLTNLIRSKSICWVRLNRYVDSIMIIPFKNVSTITLT